MVVERLSILRSTLEEVPISNRLVCVYFKVAIRPFPSTPLEQQQKQQTNWVKGSQADWHLRLTHACWHHKKIVIPNNLFEFRPAPLTAAGYGPLPSTLLLTPIAFELFIKWAPFFSFSFTRFSHQPFTRHTLTWRVALHGYLAPLSTAR